MARVFQYIFTMLLMQLFGPVSGALALGEQPEQESFNASEFGIARFRDVTLEKESFKELPSAVRPTGASLRDIDSALLEETKARVLKREHNDTEVASAGEEHKAGIALGEEKKSEPVHDLPGDWVPDKIRLPHNGGFTIAPDNGSPVPYRLNGHIDIQRGLPWEIEGI